jgi:hypothetical protein
MRECGRGGERFRKTITLRPNCRSTRSRNLNSTRAPAVAKRVVVRGEYHRILPSGLRALSGGERWDY